MRGVGTDNVCSARTAELAWHFSIFSQSPSSLCGRGRGVGGELGASTPLHFSSLLLGGERTLKSLALS